ncbi:mannosyltransferase [Savitreella phatthalungensis]
MRAVALPILLAVRTLSAAINLIHDADETFNYWEPLHYLLHGTGFQTWEYSPEYAIRSWSYIGLHAAILLPFKSGLSREMQFYLLRGVLGTISALVETKLVCAVERRYGIRVANYLLAGLASTTGMFVASTALLPSSFTMYTSCAALAFSLDRQHTLALISIASGALIGWPFSALLGLPVALNALYDKAWLSVLRAAIVSAQIALISIVVDYYFYRRWVLVALNIVLYNVFGGTERGPDLFGTEPLMYYVKNLLLNLNAWLMLASLGMVCAFARRQWLVVVGPSLWALVFFSQPHKEERFLFPAYPAVLLLGAMALADVHGLVKKLTPRTVVSIGIGALLATSASISAYRVLDLTRSYSAPLTLFPRLPAGAHVCLGNDWYRFPTTFLLQEGTHVDFYEADFHGLLPGKFTLPWLLPSGMNNLNAWDPSKVISRDSCECLLRWLPGHGHGGIAFVDRESGRKIKGEYILECKNM